MIFLVQIMLFAYFFLLVNTHIRCLFAVIAQTSVICKQTIGKGKQICTSGPVFSCLSSEYRRKPGNQYHNRNYGCYTYRIVKKNKFFCGFWNLTGEKGNGHGKATND